MHATVSSRPIVQNRSEITRGSGSNPNSKYRGEFPPVGRIAKKEGSMKEGSIGDHKL